MTTSRTPPRHSVSEVKAQNTAAAAKLFTSEQTAAREEKTTRLRNARLEMEASKPQKSGKSATKEHAKP